MIIKPLKGKYYGTELLEESGPLTGMSITLWNEAFASFKTAADATKVKDISGGEFDRAARMYEDFEKITASLKRRIKT